MSEVHVRETVFFHCNSRSHVIVGDSQARNPPREGRWFHCVGVLINNVTDLVSARWRWSGCWRAWYESESFYCTEILRRLVVEHVIAAQCAVIEDMGITLSAALTSSSAL